MSDTTVRTITIAIWLVIAFIFMLVINMHTKLVDRKNIAVDKFNRMDRYFQRRADSFPELEPLLGDYDELRSEMDALREAEKRLGAAVTETDKIRSEEAVTNALDKLLRAASSVEGARDSKELTSLISRLEELEEGINSAGADYNEAVNEYNRRFTFFPSKQVAAMFRFKEMPVYDPERIDSLRVTKDSLNSTIT